MGRGGTLLVESVLGSGCEFGGASRVRGGKLGMVWRRSLTDWLADALCADDRDLGVLCLPWWMLRG